jgi:RNA polymerase sigma-B factor
MARRYRRSDEPLDDLVQVAHARPDQGDRPLRPARETAFSSYAVPTMLGELKRYFRDNGWAGARAARDAGARDAGRQRVKDLSRRKGRSPSATRSPRLSAQPGAGARGDGGGRRLRRVSLEAYRFGDEGDGETYAESIGVEDGRFELVEYGATIAPTLAALPARDRHRACTCASSRTSRRPRSPIASASPRCTSHG